MTDTLTTEKRSYLMSKIKGKDTKPEMIVRRYLHSHGFRYRLHVKSLPGSPDIVLKKYRIAIFINGCFWHGHENCLFSRLPKTRTEWWKIKIIKNIKRDKEKCILLHNLGWHTMTVWSCQLKSTTRKDTLEEIVFLLQKIFLEQNKI